MYFRLTRYKGDPARRAEGLKWIDEKGAAATRDIGAKQIHLVEFGPGDYAMLALFEDKASADAALAGAVANFGEAARAGLIDPATIQRSEGEVVRTLVG
jgi:hypothetical protein